MTRVPQIHIGLFGLGTVGSSVYQLLSKHRQVISDKLGFPINVKKVCEPDSKKRSELNIPPALNAAKASDIFDDPEISIIVELIGDKPVAKEVMIKALRLGKHVVTANKAILAVHGPELYQEAAKNEVGILFEAAVAGSIPVLRTLREGFVADRIDSVMGIINGTANYILTGMAEKGGRFHDVLQEAQRLGLAEANPSSDIEGIDSAHKLAILITLAYGCLIPFPEIYIEGITSITPFDISMAEKFGYAVKLLAISKKTDSEIEARVHPTMIPTQHVLASVRGAFNAIMLHGHYLGQSVLYGLGAGGLPTATAVVSDIIEIARNIALRVPGVPPLGTTINQLKKSKVKSMDEVESEYYLRFTAIDKPGAFSSIAHILGEKQISISSVYQHGREEGKEVPIVVLTHRALEKNVQSALKEIDKLPVVSQKTLLIRIES